jgi:hypothetical protein
LVVASVSKYYASSFDDKSSATLNKDSKGPTNDSPAKVPTIATSIRHEVFDNYLPCRPIMNVSNTTSISAILTMTVPLNLSYITPTILLLPFNYDFPENLTATHANFTRQLIVASKRGVLHAQLIIDDVAHLFSVSEGTQDVDPAAVRKDCRVKITALKLQRNKDFQFIVESDFKVDNKMTQLSVSILKHFCHLWKHGLLLTCLTAKG